MNSLKFLNSYIPEKQRERGDFFFFPNTAPVRSIPSTTLWPGCFFITIILFYCVCVVCDPKTRTLSSETGSPWRVSGRYEIIKFIAVTHGVYNAD